MGNAQGSTRAFGVVIGLMVAACGGEAAQPTPPEAASGSATTPVGNTDAGKSASMLPPSTTTAAAAGSGAAARPSAAGSGSPTQGGKVATAPAAGMSGAAQGGTPAADSGMRFSFFVTSYAAMQKLSGSTDGFGGDLSYGESTGLKGADKICREIAESSLAGAGSKTWRAFLSATKGEDGMPVNAIDRIGEGPWYDRLGRVFALTKADALNVRPKGADAAIINDLPNEDGVPNHAPDGAMQVDNHDVLTGAGTDGKLFSQDDRYTCKDWTSSVGADGTPRVGHSWPRSGTPVGGPIAGNGGGGPGGPRMPGGGPPADWMMGAAGGDAGGRSSGDHWMSALTEAGCAAGASLVEMGGPNRNNPTVGSGGGYGAIYCFALTP